jgi:hypothetical protein
MSIKFMAKVYELAIDSDTREILMALADHADDEGYNIFPSVARIAWKIGDGSMNEQGEYKNVRTVQRRLKELQEIGALVELKPSGYHRATEYGLDLSVFPKKADFKPKGDRLSSKGDKKALKGDTTLSPEPSLNVIDPSLSKGGEPKAKEPEKTPKQEALESLEKVFFQYGGTMNPALIERFYAVFDGNPDNPKERFAHALKRLEETRSFFKAIDAYREWALPKPQSSYQRPKPGIGRAGPPTGYTPPSAEERAAFQASLARAGGT